MSINHIKTFAQEDQYNLTSHQNHSLQHFKGTKSTVQQMSNTSLSTPHGNLATTNASSHQLFSCPNYPDIEKYASCKEGHL